MPDIVLDDFNGFYFPGIQLFGQLQDAGRIDVFEPVGQFIQGAGSRFIAESMLSWIYRFADRPYSYLR